MMKVLNVSTGIAQAYSRTYRLQRDLRHTRKATTVANWELPFPSFCHQRSSERFPFNWMHIFLCPTVALVFVILVPNLVCRFYFSVRSPNT